ncbi:phage head spike fiber domain-containing protein [Aeromonas sp. 6P]|uniref:phage head spike fiber domain-containing protein n=1 Tax=Aeromonas sp. 6P TaxID=3452722 RepID=UPI003F7A2EBA
MASINQGDDAVARLDAAVTAFEEIITGPEGQTVAVPGKNPQPTLAERVKQNLKPSTDAAAGFATQAAASAKAADESAKQAAQISGLDTVADAIGLAAMPMPDVWSPLVDSLRLVTGKGKEIKISDEVVSRRWEFERLSAATERQKDGKLRLVPAGEPRYEGGALVKERGSTNLYFPHDGSSGCSAVRGSVVTSAGSGLLGETSTVKYVEDSTNGSHYLWGKNLSGFNVGDEVSISVELVPLKVGLTAIQLGCNTFTDVKANLNLLPSDIGKPIVITHKSTVTGTTVQPYVWPILGGNQNWQGDGSTVFELLSIQVEKGPPTSLIPTTTAAATRAAESVWLPGPANSPGYGKSRTYAFEFELISPSASGYITFICDGAYPTRTFLGIWSDGQLQASNDYVKAYTTQYTLKKRNVISASFDYDGGYVMFSLNGGPIVKSSVPCAVKPGQAEVSYERLEIGTLGNGGHQCSVRIRNFRQWNRPSPEAQLRAIK